MSRPQSQDLRGLEIDRKAFEVALERARNNIERSDEENARICSLLVELCQVFALEIVTKAQDTPEATLKAL